MGRLILVSNRLPVQVRRSGGRLTVTPSAGGLVAGLGPVHEHGDGLWVGNLGEGVGEGLADELEARRLVAVPLGREAAARAYEGYSNAVLWPLFHYQLDRVAYDLRDFDAYREVNSAFADAVVGLYRPGDRIWVHDYHLMLLPRMLRERLPDAVIGFFLHIPFPSSEVFRTLPRKEHILEGLLGASLVGVHTYDYARHLISTFRRVLGLEFDDHGVAMGPERCRVGVFALGVDAKGLATKAAQPAVERKLERLRKQVQGRKVIVGVDRMDYTKGLPLRLHAFRRLLELTPSWRERVVLLQLVVPSRSTIPEYKALKQEVERLVGELNGAFAVGGLTPVQYLYRSVPQDELLAMYRLADVALVTPVRDGMNLVAKEYVAAHVDGGGVLVLSELAGAASEMGEALLTNPWDVDGTAHTLDRALRMDRDEASRRLTALRRRGEVHDVHRWVERFLAALDASARLRQPSPPDRSGWRDRCVASFGRARRSLLAIDYDGTLAEIASTPERAAPTPALKTLLGRLGAQRGLDLAVVSGRDRATLSSWLGDLPIHLVAEHGFVWRRAGDDTWRELVPGTDLSWKSAVLAVMRDYAERAAGVIVEDKGSAVSWHYRLVEAGFGEWLARELSAHLVETFAQNPLEVHLGKKVVEVRPYGVNKGRALETLLAALGPADFVLAAGDDQTDEDLFAAAPDGAWTVKVGRGPTRAQHVVESPSRLRDLLDRLVRSAPTDRLQPPPS
jgi:trehalose 6-phosphate synthase/phosphatase